MTEETTEVTLEQALQQNFETMSRASDEETPADESTAAPATEGVDAAETETEETSTEVTEDSGLQPLETWSEDDKALFESLDPNVQQFVLESYKRFQSDYTKDKQKLSERTKRYDRLDQVLKPYEDRFAQSGLDITPHVAQALQAYLSYAQNPAETLKSLITQANLSPAELGFGQDDEDIDPTIKSLRDEVAQLKTRLSTQDQTQVTDARRSLESFQNEQDDEGNPKHPHFEAVRHLMAPMVAQGKTLEEAYSEAVWTLPDHRKAQIQSEAEKAKKEAAKKAAVESKRKVANAKKAGDTLPASDAAKSDEIPKLESGWKGWENALNFTSRRMNG